MSAPISNTIEYSKETTPTVVKSDQEWQKQLTTDEFYVLRQADTEPQYRGYTSFFESGIYECKGCNKPLYESGAKFKGCGYVYISIYFFRFLTFVHFLFFTFPSPSPSFTLPPIHSFPHRNLPFSWPSFDDCLPGAVLTRTDPDGRRVEIICSSCHSHLGHVFTGEGYTDKNTRHCVNSCCLVFKKKENE
jgi:peptide methionine sulfoxide reductase MsrB